MVSQSNREGRGAWPPSGRSAPTGLDYTKLRYERLLRDLADAEITVLQRR